MPIVLFTLIEENQRLNPFTQAGIIHNNGLDYIIANIGTADVAQLATNYIVANYTTYVIYPEQTIDPLSVKGFNVTVNPTDTLIDIDLDSCYNEYIQKAFSYIDSFPPTEGANTAETSYVIFNADYADQFNLDMNNLLDAILDSGLPPNQMALALIALAILNSSYAYWKNAYNNGGGGGSSWYTFITGLVSSITDLNWREVIQQDIKGALQGAVAANRNNLNNISGSRIIGAAAAGMSASAQNVVLQTGVSEFFASEELREDDGLELREDGGIELRQ